MVVICNGVPKSGTHVVLQVAEVLGFPKRIFIRALRDETSYARPIEYGADSIFLSEEAKRAFQSYLKEAPIYRGDSAVRSYISIRTDGQSASAHAHVSWHRRDLVSEYRTITVFRHPKDNLLSWIRWFGQGEAPNFFGVYRSFIGWERDLCLTYDALFTARHVLKIARRLDVPLSGPAATEVAAQVWGRSLTWTGALSDHRTQWSRELSEMWDAHQGKELEDFFDELRTHRT